MKKPADPSTFIRANLTLSPVREVPEVLLHIAHPGSGLAQLGGRAAPYWAYPWAGGAALARHVLDHPHEVSGRRVLDLGAGSGLVGIAAMKAGARSGIAAEIDPHGRAALMLNARANSAELECIAADVLAAPVPSVDVVLAGDVFYNARLARRVAAFLDRCQAAGIAILIGDPGRAALPLHRLEKLAEYAVPDFADGPSAPLRHGMVFRWKK